MCVFVNVCTFVFLYENMSVYMDVFVHIVSLRKFLRVNNSAGGWCIHLRNIIPFDSLGGMTESPGHDYAVFA